MAALNLPRPGHAALRGGVMRRQRPRNEQYTAPRVVKLDISVEPFVVRGSACLTSSADFEVRRSRREAFVADRPPVYASLSGVKLPVATGTSSNTTASHTYSSRSSQRTASQTGVRSKLLSVASSTLHSGIQPVHPDEHLPASLLIPESPPLLKVSLAENDNVPKAEEETQGTLNNLLPRPENQQVQRSSVPLLHKRKVQADSSEDFADAGVEQAESENAQGAEKSTPRGVRQPTEGVKTPTLLPAVNTGSENRQTPARSSAQARHKAESGDRASKADKVESKPYSQSPQRQRLRENAMKFRGISRGAGVLSRSSSRARERVASRNSRRPNGERAVSRASSRNMTPADLRAHSAMEIRPPVDPQLSGEVRNMCKSAGVGGRKKQGHASSDQRASPKTKGKLASPEDPLEDHQVTWFMSLWQQCIHNNTLEKMSGIMKRLPFHQRRQLANHLQNGNSMLFSCCQMGHVDMVNYLLEDCGADIEQRGVYEVSGDGTRHQVSPLWCAAVADHVDVVESLIKHGADINHPSDTSSTPVRSACFMTNIEVVKKLVEAGADIHKPNVNGGTCLINSVQSTELCSYLIRHGARVNDKDNSGNLALHYAIREGRLETVKLLIQHGSDYNAKNDYNDNALQTAALRGHDNIVEYLIEWTRPKLVEVIHAYELLGATYVDERHDIVGAMALWKKAMALRMMDTKSPILKTVRREKLAVYNYRVEATTEQELEEVAYDPDKVYMEALLLRERILGPSHKDTSFGVMFRGAIYADSHDFQRCIDLWKYAYKLRYSVAEDTLGHELVFTVVALVRLFWEVQLEFGEESSPQTIRFGDVLDTLEMLLAHIQHAQKVLRGEVVMSSKTQSLNQSISSLCSCGSHSSGPQEEFLMLMQLALNLIHLMAVKLKPDYGQRHLFYCMVYQLVKLDPRTMENETLLHLAFSLCQLDFTSEVGLPPPKVVEVLLKCGADVDAVTKSGETPLSYCLRPSTDAARRTTGTEGEKEDYLKILLEYGAHVDRVDKKGRSCLNQLKKVDSFFPLHHINLQCLAARVIRKHKDKIDITVGNKLSSPLAAFVSMH